MKLLRLLHQWSNFHCELVICSAFVGDCFILTRRLMQQKFIYNSEKAWGWRAWGWGVQERRFIGRLVRQASNFSPVKRGYSTPPQNFVPWVFNSPHIFVMGVSSHYICSMTHSARLYASWLVSLFLLLLILQVLLLILTYPLTLTIWK